MSRRRKAWWIVAPAGGALLVVGLVLALSNPSIDHTDDGTYQCFAPYDTVLLGDRNDVGMHLHAQDIQDRCYAADKTRFAWASGWFGLGVVLSGSGSVGLLGPRRRS